MLRSTICAALVIAFLFVSAKADAVVSIDWVPIGGPGNACDTQPQGCFGAVSDSYEIARYEITNTQYAEFLNAVAKTDTYGLYNINMALGTTFGGITRSGSPGSFSYSVVVIREHMPVNNVSLWDAIRFANWLHNGQPTGLQDGATTEDGAYTLTPTGITNNTVTRNGGAEFFITSEDEWYKAAYYDAGATLYFDYPASSNAATTCAVPGPTANTANCQSVVAHLTNVGSYASAASPSGTFDQGGNVWEWTESIVGPDRIQRGGDLFFDWTRLAAATRAGVVPTIEDRSIGFRVARLAPQPSLPLLTPLGLFALSALLGIRSFARLRERSIGRAT